MSDDVKDQALPSFVDMRIKKLGLINRQCERIEPDPDLVAGTHHMEWRRDGEGGIYLVKVPNVEAQK